MVIILNGAPKLLLMAQPLKHPQSESVTNPLSVTNKVDYFSLIVCSSLSPLTDQEIMERGSGVARAIEHVIGRLKVCGNCGC